MATSSKYLNSVLKILPAMQARQITDLLSEFRATGEVTNPEEYSKKLTELAAAINSESPKPSFEQIRSSIWAPCSSQAHNMMMRAAQNDIEALFEQTNEIGEKLQDHHFLMMKNLIADLERGLNEQETLIRELEWLANQNNEFTFVLVNSFRSSSLLRVPRSVAGAESFYFDNRTYKNTLIEELPNAIVSENGEKLLLDTSNDPRILALSARLLSDNSSYGTTVNVDLNNDIDNLIDGTLGTFWSRNVYLPEPVQRVTTVLEFDLGVGRDINYLIIQGATANPFFVESIIGLAPDGHEIILSNTETEINGSIRIDFSRTLLRAVKVTFGIKTYFRGEYTVDSMSSLHEILNNPELTNIEKTDALAPLIQEVLTTEELATIVNVPQPAYERINSYIYSLSLDNVWFGNSLYSDQGVFVSSPLSVVNLGVLGVQGREKAEDGIVRNSIEYEIIKVDESIQREKRFPIPNLGATQINSERLVLTHKDNSNQLINDSGLLRFCPLVPSDYEPSDESPIAVYKDGVFQEINNHYQIAVSKLTDAGIEKLLWLDSFDNTANFSNFTFNPQKMWIKIINPSSNSIYTVNYNLRFSTFVATDLTKTVWLDAEKTIYLTDGSRVQFKNEDPDEQLESKLYLQITLRRNEASQSASPELNEYAVLAANYKQEGEN